MKQKVISSLMVILFTAFTISGCAAHRVDATGVDAGRTRAEGTGLGAFSVPY